MFEFLSNHLSPFLDAAFELTRLSLIVGLLLLSLVSLAFVFHLRLKSRTCPHLQSFNLLWTVRFLLIIFIILWSVNELFRLPFFRNKYLLPLFTSHTLTQQINLCKIQVVLSLGFLEPGFLVTLLYLVNVSIKKKTPNGSWALPFILASCFPFLMFHVFFLFFSRLVLKLPDIFLQSIELSKNGFEQENALCTYPLLSSVVFCGFGVWYLVGFALSCFKVLTLVINKGLRKRICSLAITVAVALPIQIFGLGVSVLWSPEDTAYAAVSLLVFISAFILAVVGEGILVIRPIADSLAAGEDVNRWSSLDQRVVSPEEACLRQKVDDGSQEV